MKPVLPPLPPCDEQTMGNYGICDDAYSSNAMEAYALTAIAATLKAAAPDEAMVRDAMRYRYMRDATHTIRGAPIPVKEDCGFFVTGEALDAAIDAALTGEKA